MDMDPFYSDTVRKTSNSSTCATTKVVPLLGNALLASQIFRWQCMHKELFRNGKTIITSSKRKIDVAASLR